MKLKYFEHGEGYRFVLTFENGETKEVDLQELVGAHVIPDAVHTAHIGPGVTIEGPATAFLLATESIQFVSVEALVIFLVDTSQIQRAPCEYQGADVKFWG